MPLMKIAVAVVAAFVILRIGLGMLRMLARPLPEPPPVGELRKVRLVYRCAACGAEVRMTVAPSEDPEPPRHCMEEMQLATPIDE
jgi:DNA-directed RNA polymerase subunit RPC12/RpoP